MDTLITPDGAMHQAGLARSFVATVIDLAFAAVSISAFLRILGVDGAFSLGPIAAMPALIVFGYGLLARKACLPSLGNWSLALRRYPYREIEGFSGSGAMDLVEIKPGSAVLARFVVAIAAVLFLAWAGAGN